MNTDKLTTYLGMFDAVLSTVLLTGTIPAPWNLIAVGILGASKAVFGFLTNKASDPK